MTSPLVRGGLRPMRPRDPTEPHRAASSLELFFDLTFVVGVSVAATSLLHAEADGLRGGLLPFLVAFFSVWWPWVNFTWFASAFDTDDWLYRALTVLQMGGVLIVAAGIPRFVESGDLTVPVVGYVVMRLALVVQWLRSARAPEYRTTAIRYAGGVALVQSCWALLLAVPPGLRTAGVLLLVAAELAVPVWAEHRRTTPFHRRHIAERYGLFTLIVLGEGLLSVWTALNGAQGSTRGADLVLLGATALVLVAGMWWVYFSRPSPVAGAAMRGTFAYGYGHYVVFGSAAALAAGLELAIEHLADEHDGAVAVTAAATVPLALFLLSTWALVLRHALGPVARVALPVVAVLCALAALVPAGLQVAALLVVAAVVVLEVDARRRAAS
ncbi:low temperature requirement protein A [Amnibacterium endophyticum]|uniref:Low temperature requirement protein A n=1 Tax=Amnibacterium endophyticum TaxID=2109337 RepID=A0ABW4LGK7_9MICO